MTPQQTLSVLIVDLKENIFGRTYMHYVIQSHCHIFKSIKLWRAGGSTGEGGGEGTGSTHSSLDRVKKYVLYVKRFPPPPTPPLSLVCKLVPVHYRAYENGLLQNSYRRSIFLACYTRTIYNPLLPCPVALAGCYFN